jgi:outer membrane lipoprotein SlyB
MKKVFWTAVFITAMAMSGCATKQYPQAPAVSTGEAKYFDCSEIDMEIAKCRSTQDEIERTGDFDGLTVLGVLGDFGIGNGIAKGSASQKASARLAQLDNLKRAKNCP